MERASGTSEGRSTSSGEEGPRYLIGQVDVDEGGFEQRRDFLGGLSVVKHRVSLLIYQRRRVRSAPPMSNAIFNSRDWACVWSGVRPACVVGRVGVVGERVPGEVSQERV